MCKQFVAGQKMDEMRLPVTVGNKDGFFMWRILQNMNVHAFLMF